MLAGLPQPFTTAEARKALGTTRRVAIPLLEFLDRPGSPSACPMTAAACAPAERYPLGTRPADGGRITGPPAERRMIRIR